MNKYRKAVFIVAYSKKKGKREYLLLKRKLHWKGFEFPKGKIETGESKIDAAKRELKEETGLKLVKMNKFSFSREYLYDKPLKDRPRVVGQTFSLFAAEVKKGRVSLYKKEHSGHKWLDFSKAEKALTLPNQKVSLRIFEDFLNRKKNSKGRKQRAVKKQV